MNKSILSLDFIIFSTLSAAALLSTPVAVGQFILLFIILFIYLILDYWLYTNPFKFQKYSTLKIYLFIASTFIIIAPALTVRISAGNNIYIHDNIQQLEAATAFLINGQNPYEQDYSAFFIANEQIVTTTGKILPNPANSHVISLPGHILLSVPLYLSSNFFYDFYDQRILYFLALFISIFILLLIPKTIEHKIILGSLFALNPLLLKFFFVGRNDVLLLFFIIATIYLLLKNRHRLGAVMLGISCSIKHFAFFLVPFVIAYYYWQTPTNLNFSNRLVLVLKKIWPLPTVWLVINMPFIIWNPSAFYQDIVAYPLGLTADTYPINGFGISAWLANNDINIFFPLWLIQLIVSALLLYLLLRFQKKYNSPSTLIYNFTILLFVYLFLGRFFNDNYIGFVIEMFIIAYFINRNRVPTPEAMV